MNLGWQKLWNEFGLTAYDSLSKLSIYREIMQKSLHSLGKCDKILDIGCGTGNLIIEFAKIGKEVYGVDFSDGMLSKAREKIEALDYPIKKRVHIEKGDVTDLRFEDKTFDGAACINVLFNLKNPYKAVKEAYRILKNNGILVITGPKKSVNIKRIREQTAEEVKTLDLESRKSLEKAFMYNQILRNQGGISFRPSRKRLEQKLTESGFKMNIFEEAYKGESYFIELKKITYGG